VLNTETKRNKLAHPEIKVVLEITKQTANHCCQVNNVGWFNTFKQQLRLCSVTLQTKKQPHETISRYNGKKNADTCCICNDGKIEATMVQH
jgi:hypothetical protein